MKRNTLSLDADHLVITVAKQLYGLPYGDVVQIIDSPSVTALPHMDNHVRGTIDFHGEVIALYDMRKALGMTSLIDEITTTISSLRDRKQDHINWLQKLKDEVYHEREITVQTDPHKCVFGKWYDQFVTDSMTLDEYMARFDQPHKNIHAIAVRAQELIRQGRKDEAKALIHDAERSDLSVLIKLFDNAEQFIRAYTYEYAVVLERGGRKFAISADSVRSFGRFDEISDRIPPVLQRVCGDFLQAFGRIKNDGGHDEILILDVAKVVDGAACPPAVQRQASGPARSQSVTVSGSQTQFGPVRGPSPE